MGKDSQLRVSLTSSLASPPPRGVGHRRSISVDCRRAVAGPACSRATALSMRSTKRCRKRDVENYVPPSSASSKRDATSSALPYSEPFKMTRRLVASAGGDLCPSGSLNKTGMFFRAAAPGTDGIRSTRLRGQGPCAVPEGHRSPPDDASHRRS